MNDIINGIINIMSEIFNLLEFLVFVNKNELGE